MRRAHAPEITEVPTAEAVAFAAAQLFAYSAQEAVAERGSFRVALAGGTTPLAAYRLLATWPDVGALAAAEAPESMLASRPRIQWDRVEVFFGDERCVPADHPDRNDHAADESLLSRVPIPSDHVHRVDATSPDAADRYEAEIRRVFGSPSGVPSFDLILLGIGPDGHTASLFPGNPAAEEKQRLVAHVADAPKPPSSRVTFTLPLLNAARCVAFLVTGAEKRKALSLALRGDPSVPAGRVDAASIVFLVDRAALPLHGLSPT